MKKRNSLIEQMFFKSYESTIKNVNNTASTNPTNKNILIDLDENKILNFKDSLKTTYGTNDPNDLDQITTSDIVGNFGWFQFMILLFSGLREGVVGYDAVIMSIILQPEANFICSDHPNATNFNISYNKQELNDTIQCYQSVNGYLILDEFGETIKCSSWLFPRSNEGASLIAEWSLVCDRHWLVAFIQSSYFFGLVTGNLVWGFTADKIGRRKAYLIAHSIALLFGWLAVFVPNIWLFTLCRFFAAFGLVGYNIIYSIQIELIGTKYRAFSTTLNHFGWGLGVILVPFIDHCFTDHKPIVAFGPVFTLIMFPWAFWLPESSRWLMANEKFPEAKRELIRAAKFNRISITPALEKKISTLEKKMKFDKLQQSTKEENKTNSYRLLFENQTLVKDTVILALTSFTGHLFYYLLTINFGYIKNLSTDANFIISGAGEWFSIITGAILLKFFSRKTCMSFFLTLLASSFIFQSSIESNLAIALDTPTVVTLNNGIGTLSALLLIFVTLIVNQEIYPTVIRQTGSSIVNTLGESGSTLAPLIIHIELIIGQWEANLLNAFVCIVAMIGLQFLTKTDDIELPDT